MDKWKVWINGERTEAESGATYSVLNPATEEEIAEVPLCAEPDARKAVESARDAFPSWSRKPQAERSKIIRKLAEELRTHAPDLAALDALNHGSPIRRAFDAVTHSAESLECMAEAGMTMMKSCIPTRFGAPFYSQHRPLGVCAFVMPWNAPFQTMIDRMASALVVGNTCVIEPPSAMPLVALKIGEILETLDIPRGTVNILSGPDCTLGGAIAFHREVDRASFTAIDGPRDSILFSPREMICARASELGDRNRFVILEDADLDRVLPKAVFASFNNTGMTCALPGRYYVHHKVHDEFADRFVAAVERIVIGNPTCETTEMGPLATALHRDRVERFVNTWSEQGVALVTGGRRPAGPTLDRGYFITPAVFTDVTPEMRLTRDEVYGPIACILKVSSEEEIAGLIHRFSMELGASVWTGSANSASSVASAAQEGVIWINDRLVLSEEPCDEFQERDLLKIRSFLALEANARLSLVSPDLSAPMVGDARLNRN